MEEGKEVEKKKGEHTNTKRKKMGRVPVLVCDTVGLHGAGGPHFS